MEERKETRIEGVPCRKEERKEDSKVKERRWKKEGEERKEGR